MGWRAAALWQLRRAGRKYFSAMWHAVWFVVDEGPRPHGGGNADSGGGHEGYVAEERLGCGGNMDNGGMSEERVGAWACGKGRVGNAEDGGRCEECMVNRVLPATCLRNGGILMELGSNKALTWFMDAAIRSSFLELLHPGATIKSRDYHIVVQFVPLTFK